MYFLYGRCEDGYFALSADDPLGCVPCFCYGHSSNCTASTDYVVDVIRSDFTAGACVRVRASFIATVHASSSLLFTPWEQSVHPRLSVRLSICPKVFKLGIYPTSTMVLESKGQSSRSQSDSAKILKSIEWPTWVMHSVECPDSSYQSSWCRVGELIIIIIIIIKEYFLSAVLIIS